LVLVIPAGAMNAAPLLAVETASGPPLPMLHSSVWSMTSYIVPE
jgi:hypothetical protein